MLRRLARPRDNRALWWTLLIWGTLYLLQGPVYFYLLLAAIPVLAFYHPDRPIPSILALIAASFWAGISRVNWIPIPAMLAIALYLLEKPILKRSLIRYLLPPAVYAILGLGTAYAGAPVVLRHLRHFRGNVQRGLLAATALVPPLPQFAQ